MITYVYKSKKVGLFSVILKARLRRTGALLEAWCVRSGGSQIPVSMDVRVVGWCAFHATKQLREVFIQLAMPFPLHGHQVSLSVRKHC